MTGLLYSFELPLVTTKTRSRVPFAGGAANGTDGFRNDFFERGYMTLLDSNMAGKVS